MKDKDSNVGTCFDEAGTETGQMNDQISKPKQELWNIFDFEIFYTTF